MFTKTVCFLLALDLAKYNVAAVYCNFTFIDSDEQVNQASETRVVNLTTSSSRQKFDCEQDFDDEFTYVADSTGIDEIANRFNAQENFELQEVSCISSKRFITPKALNNVYNQLTPVLNTAIFVQRIQIVECRTLREPCNEHIHSSKNYRHICWQEYLIIKLLAVRNSGSVFDEDFYYPSHCSCRLVKVSKRSKKVQIFYV